MVALKRKHRLVVEITIDHPVSENQAAELILLALGPASLEVGVQRVAFSNFKRVVSAATHRNRYRLLRDVESAMDYLREVRNELTTGS